MAVPRPAAPTTCKIKTKIGPLGPFLVEKIGYK